MSSAKTKSIYFKVVGGAFALFVVVLGSNFLTQDRVGDVAEDRRDDSGVSLQQANDNGDISQRDSNDRLGIDAREIAEETSENSSQVDAKDSDYLSWMAAHGYYTPDDLESYESYGVAALESLAEGGDLLASVALYQRHLEESDIESALQAAYEGAVHGSTRVMTLLANKHVSNALSHEQSNVSAIKADLIDALAWYEVALMRGDLNAYGRGVGLISQFDVRLSPDDLGLISERAQSHYAGLEQDRSSRGLQPFANTQIERSKAFVEVTDSTDWGRNYLR